MCRLAQALDQCPETTQSPRWPPHPSLEASVTIDMVGSGCRKGQPTQRLACEVHHSNSARVASFGRMCTYGLSETCVHWSWSISWFDRVWTTAIGTNSRRMDRCPRNLCQVFADWAFLASKEAAIPENPPFAREHEHIQEIQGRTQEGKGLRGGELGLALVHKEPQLVHPE